MTPEEYFKKWAENCRIFIDYKPIHDHRDMMQFAKDYHAEQQRELIIAFMDAFDKDEINVYQDAGKLADEFLAIYSA